MENEKMNIYEKLSHIQNEMNVPKNLYNKFGNYYYRNAETILETAKPICAKYRTTLTVEDEIVCVHGASHKKVEDNEKDIMTDVATEGRFYVKAIATLHDWDSAEKVVNSAYARESEKKTGMDDSQLTGSCSSYARKYALNGLFNLDDVKDADTNEMAQETKNKDNATKQQVTALLKVYKGDNLTKLLKANNIARIEDLPKAKATEILKAIAEKQKGKANETNK